MDGTWINLPCPDIWEEIKENCIEGAEEFFIMDYECYYFEINENADIDEINEIAERLTALTEDEEIALEALWSEGEPVGDALDMINDCIVWRDCTMEDVAMAYYEGMYLDNPLFNYIDWSALARDIEIEGHFVDVDGDIVEIMY